tara:strand:- start:277 stop:420 length:144 start_codon:yes stop_codon:yes gene_type:complete
MAAHDRPSMSFFSEGADMRGGWVCIMTDKPNGTLYVSVTSDLSRRVF